jgi:hypothetical protein
MNAHAPVQVAQILPLGIKKKRVSKKLKLYLHVWFYFEYAKPRLFLKR